MRSEFENSLNHTDGFHDGYVKWNELSNQYESSDEDYLDVAEWMNGTLAICCGMFLWWFDEEQSQ